MPEISVGQRMSSFSSSLRHITLRDLFTSFVKLSLFMTLGYTISTILIWIVYFMTSIVSSLMTIQTTDTTTVVTIYSLFLLLAVIVCGMATFAVLNILTGSNFGRRSTGHIGLWRSIGGGLRTIGQTTALASTAAVGLSDVDYAALFPKLAENKYGLDSFRDRLKKANESRATVLSESTKKRAEKAQKKTEKHEKRVNKLTNSEHKSLRTLGWASLTMDDMVRRIKKSSSDKSVDVNEDGSGLQKAGQKFKNAKNRIHEGLSSLYDRANNYVLKSTPALEDMYVNLLGGKKPSAGSMRISQAMNELKGRSTEELVEMSLGNAILSPNVANTSFSDKLTAESIAFSMVLSAHLAQEMLDLKQKLEDLDPKMLEKIDKNTLQDVEHVLEQGHIIDKNGATVYPGYKQSKSGVPGRSIRESFEESSDMVNDLSYHARELDSDLVRVTHSGVFASKMMPVELQRQLYKREDFCNALDNDTLTETDMQQIIHAYQSDNGYTPNVDRVVNSVIHGTFEPPAQINVVYGTVRGYSGQEVQVGDIGNGGETIHCPIITVDNQSTARTVGAYTQSGNIVAQLDRVVENDPGIVSSLNAEQPALKKPEDIIRQRVRG